MKRAETQADLRPNATDGANAMGKANTINEDKPTNADADGHATKTQPSLPGDHAAAILPNMRRKHTDNLT